MLAKEHKTIYIVGPTASGKTALSINIASAIGAEIICADSQTVRREMNIGTAKPSNDEMMGIPHHLLDQIGPYDDYSLAVFQNAANEAILDIKNRGKNVVIVGGTGLYVDSLYFNYKLPKLSKHADPVKPSVAGSHLATRCDPATDGAELIRITDMTAAKAGVGYEDLSVVDLQKLIHHRGLLLPRNHQNPRHLINILLRGGNIGGNNGPTPRTAIVGINPGRDVLINRINSRVEKMFEGGFVDEVRGLVTRNGRPSKSFDAIGYRIAMRMLDGELAEDEAKELFKIADRQYAKRQIAWFKRNSHIVWFESPEQAKDYILSL